MIGRNNSRHRRWQGAILVGAFLLMLGGPGLNGVAEGGAAKTKGAAAKSKGEAVDETDKTGALTSSGVIPGQHGTIVVDSGFRPNPDGFRFANYGAKYPHGDLTADDARRLFGDQVCEYIKNDRCFPTPSAQVWIDEMNIGMKNGHCEGMAALSLLLFGGKEQASTYGGVEAADLPSSNAPLLQEIAYYWTMQTLEPQLSETLKMQRKSPQDILQAVIASLRSGNDPYTLGIYGAVGGHAITPYAVEDVGNGKFWIHVYDNNYPGAGKYVEVDTVADTWTYSGAALNPGEDAAPWSGGAGTMDLTSLSSRAKQMKCPFCQAEESCEQASDLMMVVNGKGSAARAKGAAAKTKGALVTEMRIENGKVINDMPGGKITRMKGGAARTKGAAARTKGEVEPGGDRPTLMVIPPDPEQEYTATIKGETNTEPEPVRVTGFRACGAFILDDLVLKPGQEDQLVITDGGKNFNFIPGAKQSPTLKIATTSPVGRDGLYEIKNLTMGQGYPFSLFLDSSNQKVVIGSKDPKANPFDLTVTTMKGEDSQRVEYEGISLRAGEFFVIVINPDGSVSLSFDVDGDLTPDMAYTETDRAVQDMFTDFQSESRQATTSSSPDAGGVSTSGTPETGARPGGPESGQPRVVTIPVTVGETK